MKKLIFLMVFFALICIEGFAMDLKGITIHIAEDGAEWPPYTYYERVNGKATNEIVGYSIDVIDTIFKKNGINYTVELLPWKRALSEVKGGKNYQLILSASYNEERAKNYYMSIPYYSTNPYYFYSKKNNPKGIVINSNDDFKKYKIGGLLGYNYDSCGVDKDLIDTGAKNYSQLVKKLKANRFDLFYEQFEAIAGYSTITEDILNDKDLVYAPLSYLESANFHMLMPKSEVGAELKKIIDEGISSMEKSGELKKLLKKYVP